MKFEVTLDAPSLSLPKSNLWVRPEVAQFKQAHGPGPNRSNDTNIKNKPYNKMSRIKVMYREHYLHVGESYMHH